jgi:hypothetical protein
MKLLITNGGTHPPDKWADTTVESLLDLIQIDEASSSAAAVTARAAKRALRAELFDAILPHHRVNQSDERAALSDDAAEHLCCALDPGGAVEKAFADIHPLLLTGPFKAHFSQPHVIEVVRATLARDFGTAAYIERSHHCDRHPHTDEAKAFRRAHG